MYRDKNKQNKINKVVFFHNTLKLTQLHMLNSNHTVIVKRNHLSCYYFELFHEVNRQTIKKMARSGRCLFMQT